jgi:hypothetical protein
LGKEITITISGKNTTSEQIDKAARHWLAHGLKNGELCENAWAITSIKIGKVLEGTSRNLEREINKMETSPETSGA